MTDNTTASADTVPPELITLVNRVKEGTMLVETKKYEPSTSNLLHDLNSLWMEAKGNGVYLESFGEPVQVCVSADFLSDVVKGHIGDGLSCQLVALAACEDLEVAISSAKLLRSITVNSEYTFCLY